MSQETDPGKAQAVGSIHQALLSGVLVQWLIDPDRAPSAHDLLAGLQVITGDMTKGVWSPRTNTGRCAPYPMTRIPGQM